MENKEMKQNKYLLLLKKLLLNMKMKIITKEELIKWLLIIKKFVIDEEDKKRTWYWLDCEKVDLQDFDKYCKEGLLPLVLEEKQYLESLEYEEIFDMLYQIHQQNNDGKCKTYYLSLCLLIDAIDENKINILKLKDGENEYYIWNIDNEEVELTPIHLQTESINVERLCEEVDDKTLEKKHSHLKSVFEYSSKHLN